MCDTGVNKWRVKELVRSFRRVEDGEVVLMRKESQDFSEI